MADPVPHTQCVLRKGAGHFNSVYIPSKLAAIGTVVDYKTHTHLYYVCCEGRRCDCKLGWQLGWTVHETYSEVVDLFSTVISDKGKNKKAQTTFAVKTRRHEP